MRIHGIFDPPSVSQDNHTFSRETTRAELWERFYKDHATGSQIPVLQRSSRSNSESAFYKGSIDSPSYVGPDGMYWSLRTSYKVDLNPSHLRYDPDDELPEKIAVLKCSESKLLDNMSGAAFGPAGAMKPWHSRLEDRRVNVLTDQGQQVDGFMTTRFTFDRVGNAQASHGLTFRDALVNHLAPGALGKVKWGSSTVRDYPVSCMIPTASDVWATEANVKPYKLHIDIGQYDDWGRSDQNVVTALMNSRNVDLDQPFASSDYDSKAFSVPGLVSTPMVLSLVPVSTGRRLGSGV